MAVKDESLHHATEDLILPKPRKYYQALINNSHWQLRSLIASPEPNIVYYVSGQDITSLNTKTQEREVVFSVRFAPRCLTASKDWICVGGDEGDYVAMSMDQVKASRLAALDLDLDADARLPLDLDVNSMHRYRESARRNQAYPRTIAKALKVGMEIVNCITLWEPSADASSKAYTVPVSVVANNDRSIIIQTLSEDPETLQTINFPACVNRAVISPDGSIMATISDDPYLYIHERRRIEPPKENRSTSSIPTLGYEWVRLCRIQLEGQGRAEEHDEMKGCFAVCFSSTGRYLAVATQLGIIQVLRVDTITERESLIAVFTTSRPFAGMRISSDRDGAGAVRAMAFSPGPFDLLAWTESSGRIGVADMRKSYFSRQLIMLDHTDESFDKIQITTKSSQDSSAESSTRPLPIDALSLSNTPDYLGLDFDRRQLRHLHRELDHRGHQGPLTPAELSVLQAMHQARSQRDAASASPEALLLGSSARRRMGTESGSEAAGRRSFEASFANSAREYINQRQPMFSDLLNVESQSRERRIEISRMPRSGNSVSASAADPESAPGPSNPTISSALAGAGNISNAASILHRLALLAGRPVNASTSNTPRADGNTLVGSRSPDAITERYTRMRVELEEDANRSNRREVRRDEMRREFEQRIRQHWGSLDADGFTPASETYRIPDTMGLSWSPDDGRILYAAASDGIYEFQVNVTGRKVFPDLVLR